MRIAVDAFGGDNAPLEIVKGAALASNEFGVDITALVIEDITSYESSSPATEECFEETEVPAESPQEEALSTVETEDEQQQ